MNDLAPESRTTGDDEIGGGMGADHHPVPFFKKRIVTIEHDCLEASKQNDTISKESLYD